MATSTFPRIVIVGGGFAGLAAARELAGRAVSVTLVDRRNHHLFQPLLYQVATAALNPSDIAEPIRRIFRRDRNVEVVLGEVVAIDAEARCLRLADGAAVAYDGLLLAPGATHAYFGRDDWAPRAPGLKTLEDALEIRGRVLGAFESAERETDPARRAAWLTFVVIGGGPTGVELAGALAEIAHHALARDFRHIDPAQAKVLLLEGGPRILAAFPEISSAAAAQQLERLGAEVRVGARVIEIDADGVETSSGRIAARTVLWAAGVAASPLGAALGAPTDRAGRVQVEPDLSVPARPEIFVAGDLAAITCDGQPVPGVAPAATQMGRHAARNLLAHLAGRATAPFRYVDKGSLATIGRASAVACIGRARLSGWIAWLAWLAIHIWYLIGFRNRLLVMIEWCWAYVSFDRGARLITGRGRDKLAP